jgi:glycogen(starch) synthase
VRFLGWQDYGAAIALSARAHLCVVPSVCEEACSTTVLEALALGRPCVALARGGTPELAVYQSWEGQLQLAPTMPDLAARVLALLAHPARGAASAPAFGADAALALPRLLDFYAD